jgi:polar amino acid transport system substrate-binding protein
MKRAILSLFCCLLGTFLVGCSNESSSQMDQYSRIKEEKKIVIGVDDTFVPMGFRDKSKKLVGFDIDLARAVFKKYGIAAEFKSIDWDMKEQELENQTIDLIWNGYSKNKQREKVQLFSKTYMKNDQILVTKKESKITSFAQMKGHKLGTQRGSASFDVFMDQPKVLKQYIKGEPVLYENFNEAFLDLKAGRIDGLLIDNVYANYYLKQAGEIAKFNLTKGNFKSEDFAVGARKADKQLVSNINKALDSLHKTEEFQKISKKWFGKDVWPNETIRTVF